MVSDETIRKAAEVLRPVMDEHGWVLWGTCECGLDLDVKHGTYRQSYKAHEADVAVRALSEDGLLAPAPLREEWATRFPDGHLCPGKDRDYDLWFKGDPPKGVNVRRYVTDWEEA